MKNTKLSLADFKAKAESSNEKASKAVDGKIVMDLVED
jgi:hypothetical protein